MPVKRIDSDNGVGNIIEGTGIVTDEEFIRFFKEHLTQDEKIFKKYRYSIVDFTKAIKFEINNESVIYIEELCRDASRVNPDPIVALVAKGDLAYGLSRMYEGLVIETDWETMVFKSRKDAKLWIVERVAYKFGIKDLTFSD